MEINYTEKPIIAGLSLIGGGLTKGINPYPEPFWLVYNWVFVREKNIFSPGKCSRKFLLDRLGNILGEKITFAVLCCKFFEDLKGGIL